MKFLLDTDICSAVMRRPAALSHRFFQYGMENIAISTVTLAELSAGAYQRADPQRLLRLIDDLRSEIRVLAFDAQAAEVYGYHCGRLARRGLTAPQFDLMIAAVALAHDLTLVTHNTADFERIPNLRIEDWLSS
ncbi:MAG: type II toxin-antitoxin system VapC family toxin [Planctomycetia bacterium]|mgnify:CR=1 FL=1|nr:type II toxin-antitoxin system VapC family toxin [Planctomycetia bacterium]